MTDLWLVFVVTSAICGVAGYVFAKKTRRDPIVWTLLGILLNIFIVAIIAGREKRTTRRL